MQHYLYYFIYHPIDFQCGRPYVQSTCNVCGSVIGGLRHEKAANNRDARTYVTSMMWFYSKHLSSSANKLLFFLVLI